MYNIYASTKKICIYLEESLCCVQLYCLMTHHMVEHSD